MIVLEAVDLAKVYTGGDGGTITVLDGVNLAGVARARWWPWLARVARARARCCICSARSTSRRAATVRIAGESLAGRTDDELSELRNRSIGFVFQFHHLLREFTALENVMMPLRIAGWDDERARRRARELARARRARGARASPARGAVRGRAAAHRGRARAGDRSGRCCWPTSRRAISTT